MSRMCPTCRTPDAIDNAPVVARIVVTVYENGAMSTEGDIHERTYAVAMLEQAAETLRNRHLREGQIVVPA